MAEAKKTSGSHDLHSHFHLDCSGTTPPERQVQLPPTPPATDERRRRDSDASTVDGLLSILNQYQNQAQTSNIASLIKVNITKQQYDELRKTIEHSVPRFDHEPENGCVILRMPSPVHDFFSTLFADDVRDQLKSVAEEGGKAGEFASQITSGGSSRILLAEQDSESPRDVLRRQPDAQFQHPQAAYPGVVVEVSYSQDGKNLQRLAQDYILYSNGDVKAVIGFDINYGGKMSTVSLWRPKYTRSKSEKVEILEIRQVISCLPFRSSDGQVLNQNKYLTLSLSDFATDEISCDCQPVSISITFDELFHFINRAERMQQAREPEPGDTGQSIKSRRTTRKRRLSSSPVDELRSGDEAKFRIQEHTAAQRAATLDEDFRPLTAKRRV